MESIIFILQCNFTSIFLFHCYVIKRRSGTHDQDGVISSDKSFLRIDIWNNRKAADFMHYIKNEFLNAQMIGTYVMVDIEMIYCLYYGVPGTRGRHIRGYAHEFRHHTSVTLLCFMLGHCLQHILLSRILHKKNSITK